MVESYNERTKTKTRKFTYVLVKNRDERILIVGSSVGVQRELHVASQQQQIPILLVL